HHNHTNDDEITIVNNPVIMIPHSENTFQISKSMKPVFQKFLFSGTVDLNDVHLNDYYSSQIDFPVSSHHSIASITTNQVIILDDYQYENFDFPKSKLEPKSNVIVLDDDDNEKQSSLFVCPVCDQNFKQESELNIHLQNCIGDLGDL